MIGRTLGAQTYGAVKMCVLYAHNVRTSMFYALTQHTNYVLLRNTAQFGLLQALEQGFVRFDTSHVRFGTYRRHEYFTVRLHTYRDAQGQPIT